MSEVYLSHHGILGQKWGERNGPPYPLDENDLSAAERKADTGEIKRDPGDPVVRRDRTGKIKKVDYSNMDTNDLRKLVERMELENRYLRAIDVSKGKSYTERLSSKLNTLSQITNSANQLLQFTTGKTFAQKLAEISDNKVKKSGLSDDDISSLFDDFSYKINRNHKPSVEVQNRLADLGFGSK